MAQQVWLITGCSSGFGEVFTRQLLAGATLVIATARKVERIQHLKEAGAAVLQLDVQTTSQKLRDKSAGLLLLSVDPGTPTP